MLQTDNGAVKVQDHKVVCVPICSEERQHKTSKLVSTNGSEHFGDTPREKHVLIAAER